MKFNFLSAGAALLLAASSAMAITYNSTTVGERKIVYKGGPVLTGPVNVYFVFYGNWTKETSEATHTILMDFIDYIGQSQWFNTFQYFTDSHGKGISGPIKSFAGVIDAYSQHQNPNSSDFHLAGHDAYTKIIQDAAANTQHLGESIDSHGIYLVFTSEDVSMDGFCTEWCGYNSWTDQFLFAIIGHPKRCPDACVPPLNREVSPNGNIYADAMVTTLAHELIDLLTDPVGNGYRVAESDKEEVGDFCMPPTATTAEWLGQEGVDLNKTESGAYYNIVLGENGQYKHLIQSIWSPKESKCVMGSIKA
jgi:hypothetical protein